MAAQVEPDFESDEEFDPDAKLDAGSQRSAEAASAPGFPGEFQKLLQLASHLKSAQPEVREKRARWDRLKFHEKNSVLFQAQDHALRYGAAATAGESASATVPPLPVHTSHFDSQRMVAAQAMKLDAGQAYARGEFGPASLSYQRAIALFLWARKYSGKDGDEIEWYDLLDPTKCTSAQLKRAARTVATPAAVDPSASTADGGDKAESDVGPLHAPLPLLTAAQHVRAAQFVFTCLVNMAACELGGEQWAQVVEAGESALGMNVPLRAPASTEGSDAPGGAEDFPVTALTVKALYRCASAYEKLDEIDRAVALLQRAALLAPGDALVSRMLATLQREQVIQARKDKRAFGGMFDRAQAREDDDDVQEFTTPAAAASSTASVAAGSFAAASSSSTAAAGMNAPEQTSKFLADYLRGFQEQAAKTRQKEKEQRRKVPAEDGLVDDDEDELSLDTSAACASSAAAASSSAPSAERLAAMYAEARQNFDIDLSDPLVQEELRRVQAEHMRTGKTASEREEEWNRKQAQQATQPPPVRPTAVSELDLGGSSWHGPVLFCIVLAVALKWMGLMPF